MKLVGLSHALKIVFLNQRWIIIILLGVGVLLTSCSEEAPTDPFIPGKRDYVWSLDTLFYQGNAQTTMQSIYGTSSNNVYVVGHCEVSGGRMWHYNGANWQAVNLSSIRGGLNAIAGSGASNIWAVGGETFVDSNSHFVDTTFIIHNNGAGWTKTTGFTRKKAALYCVSVLSPTSVWAAGSMGTIYRLNGSTWELYEIGWQYFISSITTLSPTECYVIGHVSDNVVPLDSSGSFLFRFDGAAWLKVDSVMETPGAPIAHRGSVVYSRAGTLYSLGPNVYRRNGANWVKLLDALAGHMYQNSSSDVFAVGRSIWHFNGVNWFEFAQFQTNPGDFWYDCYADNGNVFVVGNDNQRTFVLHGK